MNSRLNLNGNRLMNNLITFKYNGKIWNPKNPEKKLKQLGITWDDVEIIDNQPKEEKQIEMNDIKMYYFRNPKNGYTISSIYPNLDHLKKDILDINDYEFIKTSGNGL